MTRKRKRILIAAGSSAGFTLVEVLMALVLLSLLSVALFSTVRGGTLVWSLLSATAQANDDDVHVRDLLRQLLGNTYPLFLSEGADGRHVDFVGNEHALAFLTKAPLALGRGDRSRVVLSAEQTSVGVDLTVASQPELATAESVTRQRLVMGASKIEFAYFGASQPREIPQWRDQWSGAAMLPRLIRVRAQFSAAENRKWPDLVIAPRIKADVGCVLDQMTTHCQGR